MSSCKEPSSIVAASKSYNCTHNVLSSGCDPSNLLCLGSRRLKINTQIVKYNDFLDRTTINFLLIQEICPGEKEKLRFRTLYSELFSLAEINQCATLIKLKWNFSCTFMDTILIFFLTTHCLSHLKDETPKAVSLEINVKD